MPKEPAYTQIFSRNLKLKEDSPLAPVAKELQAELAEAAETGQLTCDDDLEEALERYLVLKDYASEYEKLKKKLKPIFEGTPETIIGRFKVKGQYVEQPKKEIPPCRYWDMRVSVVLKSGND